MLFFLKNIAKAENNRVLPAEEKKLNSGGRVWTPLSSALWLQNSKMRSGKLLVSGKTIMLLCLASILAGSIFTSRKWTQPDSEINTDLMIPTKSNHEKLRTISRKCDHKRVSIIFKLLPIVVYKFNLICCYE